MSTRGISAITDLLHNAAIDGHGPRKSHLRGLFHYNFVTNTHPRLHARPPLGTVSPWTLCTGDMIGS